MPLPTRISLPAAGRPVGGLLSAARPGPVEQWWRGVPFASGVVCLAPQNVGTCTDGEVAKTFNDLGDPASFDAFALLQALQCSTLGRSTIEEMSGQALDVTREFAVASELLTGAATGNPSLADAVTDLSAAGDPVMALGCLEQAASVALSGRLAFIHTAPAIATALLAEGAIYREGRLWYTAAGHIVVISPAYDGREPGAGAPAGGAPMWLY